MSALFQFGFSISYLFPVFRRLFELDQFSCQTALFIIIYIAIVDYCTFPSSKGNDIPTMLAH